MGSNYKKLGVYIRQIDTRNSDARLGEDNLYGISVTKEFIISHANLVGVTFDSYKVVAPRQFAYIPDTSRRGDKIAISLNTFGKDIIVSSICSVFEIIDEDELLPEYLMLWFMRPEFDRYARFMSNGSAREVFDWDSMCGVELPVPSLPEQRKIVWNYGVIARRISILNSINNNMLTRIACIFSNMFDNDGHQLRPLSEAIATANTGGDAIQKVPIVDFDTGIKCARVGDITNARTYPSWSFCKASKSTIETFKLSKGDILVTRTATLGITQYIDKDLDAVFNNGLIRLRVNRKQVHPIWLYWAMNMPSFLNYINQMNSGTSVRPNMKIEYLLGYKLYIPSLDQQEAFVDVVRPMKSIVTNHYTEILKLTELQSALMCTLQ